MPLRQSDETSGSAFKEVLSGLHTLSPHTDEWEMLNDAFAYLPTAEVAFLQSAHSTLSTLCLHRTSRKDSKERILCYLESVERVRAVSDQYGDVHSLVASFLSAPYEYGWIQLSEIGRAFGQEVVALIQGVSGSPVYSNDAQKLRGVLGYLTTDVRVPVLAVAFHYAALRVQQSQKNGLRKNVSNDKMHTLWMRIAERLSMHRLADVMQRLLYLEADATAFTTLSAWESRRVLASHDAVRTVQEALAPSNITAVVSYRSVSLSSLPDINSVEKNSPPIDIDIECGDVESCYAVWNMLHTKFRHVQGSFVDCISAPDVDGSEELRTTLLTKTGSALACRIGTAKMKHFSQMGAATLCFGGGVAGASEYFPWIPVVQNLLKETASKDHIFLQALHQDVVCPQQPIYIEGDRLLYMPAHATGLDIAFAALGERALFLAAVYVDEKPLAFHMPLPRAAHVRFELASHLTAHAYWSRSVQTTLAREYIRHALQTPSVQSRVIAGRALLQSEFHRHGKGFLDEYVPETFERVAHALYCVSFDSVLIAIADGDISADSVYAQLFDAPAISTRRKSTQRVVAAISVILVWTMDPVFAKALLIPPYAVSPYDFTIMRMLSFLVLSAVVFAFLQSGRAPRLRMISWNDPFLWCAAVSYLIVAFATYTSLQALLPQEYITVTYATALLIPVLHPFLSQRVRGIPAAISMIVGFGAVPLVVLLPPTHVWQAALSAFAVLCSFVLFTIAVDAFKRRNHIRARTPLFLISLSVLTAALSVPLLSMSTNLISVSALLLFCYGMVLSVSYYLFYLVLSTDSAQTIATHFVFGTVMTLIGQYVLFGSVSLAALLPLAMVILTLQYVTNAYSFPVVQSVLED